MDVLDRIMHRIQGTNGKPAETRVLTIRLPAVLHEALKEEARDRESSVNKLAIAKLAVKASFLDEAAELMPKGAK